MSQDEDLERIGLAMIVTDSGQELFLQTTIKENGFGLTILAGDSVWKGEVTEDDLDRLSSGVSMDFNSYVKETRAAFTNASMKDIAFACDFKSTASGKAQLSWKKIPAEDIKFHLGTIDLKKSKDPSLQVCRILAECIQKTKDLEARIRSLQTDNDRLSLERQHALKRLEKCVTAKEELEKDLYSKFVAVLNSKKEKIRELEDGRFSNETQGHSANVSSVPSTSRESNGVVKRAQRHDPYDKDTDEEETQSIEPRKKQGKKSPAKMATMDSSLNLGDDDEDTNKTVTRRPRRQAASKKQTPSRPILPRVSSGNTPGTNTERPGSAGLQGRQSSLRKSGSNKSNKSSDNIDPDDLLDNF